MNTRIGCPDCWSAYLDYYKDDTEYKWHCYLCMSRFDLDKYLNNNTIIIKNVDKVVVIKQRND